MNGAVPAGRKYPGDHAAIPLSGRPTPRSGPPLSEVQRPARLVMRLSTSRSLKRRVEAHHPPAASLWRDPLDQVAYEMAAVRSPLVSILFTGNDKPAA